MNVNEAIQKLSTTLGDPYIREDEYSFRCCNNDCPSLEKGKRKLTLNVATGNWHCWVCEVSGRSINSLLYKSGLKGFVDTDQKENLDEFDGIVETLKNIDTDISDNVGRVIIPKDFKPIITHQDPNSNFFKQALLYLRKRGIQYFDIIKFRIHYNIKNYQILVPSYDNNGNVLVYFVRNIFDDGKDMPKVPKTKIIFNEIFVDWNSPIILVEGVFDALTTGMNAIPILGSSLKSDTRLFKELVKNNATVYVALDPDAREKAMNIAKNLFHHGLEVFIVRLEGQDINEMGREEFKKSLNQATIYNDMTDIKSRLLDLA